MISLQLVAVADGLGGHTGGEIASAVAIDTLKDFVATTKLTGRSRRIRTRKRDSSAMMREAFESAHFAILKQAERDAELAEMSTTLCALALDPDGFVVLANVGDSRIYRLSGGEFEQMTWDHNNYNELIKTYGSSPAEALQSISPMSLSRVVGYSVRPPEVDTWVHDAVAGHRYLLTSDGLTGELRDEEISEVLKSFPERAEAAEELVNRACERGGRDNITVVVVDIALEETEGNTALSKQASDTSKLV